MLCLFQPDNFKHTNINTNLIPESPTEYLINLEESQTAHFALEIAIF